MQVISALGSGEITEQPIALRQRFHIKSSLFPDDPSFVIFTEPSIFGYRFAIQRALHRPQEIGSLVFGGGKKKGKLRSYPPKDECKLSIYFDIYRLDSSEFTQASVLLHLSSSTRLAPWQQVTFANSKDGSLLKVGEISIPPSDSYVLSISVSFPGHDTLPLSSIPRAGVLDTVNDWIQGRESTDVMFCVYTSRGSRRLTKPRRLFASRRLLLGHCEYLDEILNLETPFKIEMVDDFASCKENPVAQLYDCADSDSDLEFDEGENDYGSPANGATSLRPLSPECEYHLTESAIETRAPTSASIETCDLNTSEQSTLMDQPDSIADSKQHKRIIVPVTNAAFATWKALLQYLYTGRIIFLPLTSQGGQLFSTDPLAVPCSAKSMYRLADMMGLEALKKKSLKRIKGSLSETNILQEVFSSFTVLFDEVLNIEIDALVALYPQVGRRILDDLVAGDLVQSSSSRKVLAKIMDALYRVHPSQEAIHDDEPCPQETINDATDSRILEPVSYWGGAWAPNVSENYGVRSEESLEDNIEGAQPPVTVYQYSSGKLGVKKERLLR